MKIIIENNVVEFHTENPQETADMETLWRVMVDCISDNKRMEPIGEFIPTKSQVARFIIEGVPAKTVYSNDKAEEERTVICATCNKYCHLKPGDSVPLCCGKVMESID